jgi:SAM-dependent methyltransferase
MLQSSESLAKRLIGERRLGRTSLVIEVGSNDGYLLQFYRDQDIPVLGIDPAVNVAQVAREERGIPTLGEFFSKELADRLASDGLRADVIHAHNVLAHVADLNGVIAGIHALLLQDGVAVVEVPYVRDMVDGSEFDTIYHEHLCYFSVVSLDNLLARHGLSIRAVEHIPIHGGSLRIFVCHGANRTESVDKLLTEETASGMRRVEYYATLNEKVTIVRDSLVSLLGELKGQGKRISAYGAAAKGATLLGYCGVNTETVDYVIDRSPSKQGHYLPGVRIPIVGPERLSESRPDFLLILAWNLADEIIQQEPAFRASGGQFIVPVPQAHIVA